MAGQAWGHSNEDFKDHSREEILRDLDCFHLAVMDHLRSRLIPPPTHDPPLPDQNLAERDRRMLDPIKARRQFLARPLLADQDGDERPLVIDGILSGPREVAAKIKIIPDHSIGVCGRTGGRTRFASPLRWRSAMPDFQIRERYPSRPSSGMRFDPSINSDHGESLSRVEPGHAEFFTRAIKQGHEPATERGRQAELDAE